MAARAAAPGARRAGRAALAATRRAAEQRERTSPAVGARRPFPARGPPRCGARAAARASGAPVLDVQAAQRKVWVVRVINNVFPKRPLVTDLVQRLNRHAVASARHAVGRHDEGRAAGDADADRLCAGKARATSGAGFAAAAIARCVTPRRTHVWACCRCPRSWGSRRSAQRALPGTGSARATHSTAPLAPASFGRRSGPGHSCEASTAQDGCGPRCRACSGVGAVSGVHGCTALKAKRACAALLFATRVICMIQKMKLGPRPRLPRPRPLIAAPPAARGAPAPSSSLSLSSSLCAARAAARAAACSLRSLALRAARNGSQRQGATVHTSHRRKAQPEAAQTHRSACRSACARTSAA